MAAGRKGANNLSMLSSERPLTKASAPDNCRDNFSRAWDRSCGTFTRSGVRARSSRVPSMSKNRAVFPLTGGIIQGFRRNSPLFHKGKIKWVSIQWDRNAQTPQWVPAIQLLWRDGLRWDLFWGDHAKAPPCMPASLETMVTSRG